MAEQSAGGWDPSVPSWKCIHCQFQIHVIPEEFDRGKCLLCKKEQVPEKSLCKKCKAELATPTANICLECDTIQSPVKAPVQASQAVLQGGHPGQAVLQGGQPSQTVLQSGQPSQTTFQGGHPSHAVYQSSHPTHTVHQGGHPNQVFLLQGGHTSHAVYQSSHPTHTVHQGGHPNQVVLQGGHPSQAILQGGQPSQAVLQGGHPSQAVLQGGQPSQTVLQGGNPSHTIHQSSHPTHAVLQSGQLSHSIHPGGHPSQVVLQGGQPSQPSQPSQVVLQGGQPNPAILQGGHPSHVVYQGSHPTHSVHQPSHVVHQSGHPSHAVHHAGCPSPNTGSPNINGSNTGTGGPSTGSGPNTGTGGPSTGSGPNTETGGPSTGGPSTGGGPNTGTGGPITGGPNTGSGGPITGGPNTGSGGPITGGPNTRTGSPSTGGGPSTGGPSTGGDGLGTVCDLMDINNNGQFLPPKRERKEESLYSEDKSNKKKRDRKKQNDDRSQSIVSSPGAHAGANGGPSSNTRSRTSTGVATESHPLVDAEVIEINTTGIHPPPEKEFLVIFHVLIPLYAWDSKITASNVSLRFGHHTLGNWKSNIGEFKLVREVNQDVIEVECRLTMNYDILKSQTSVHYKYYVNISSRKDEYEYLHDAPGGGSIKNRCLKVTRQEAEREGVYHQYDNMIFPERKGKGRIRQTFAALKDIVTGSDPKKEELVVPNHETMQSWALETFFEQYRAILSECKISSSLNIEAATTKILHIFNSLNLLRVSNENERLFPWKCEKLSEIFVGHLISIVKDLCQLEIKGALENGKRMSSVLVILCCLHHMIPEFFKMDKIYPQNKSALLYMLRLMPDPVQRKCLDWEYVMNMIPPTFKKTVYEAVLGFTVDLGHTEYLSKPQWLYSVPLVHLLRGTIQPFQELCLDPSKVPWGDTLIGLRTIRSKTYANEYIGIVEFMFSDLKPLIELDPSLLYCFVYICPRKELPQLFSQLLPFISMAFSVELLKNSRTYNREDVQEATKRLNFIADSMRSRMETRFQLLMPTLDASFYLLTETISKLGSNQEDYRLEFLKRSITLVLESVKIMKLFESNDRDIKIALNVHSAGALERLFHIMNKYFKETVGESFGIQHSSWFWKQTVEEVKIWNAIIPMEISCDEVRSMWENDVVAKIVKSRIDKVDLGKRFDLFCSLESVPNTHGIITNAFLNAVMDAIKLVSTENIERLISSSSVQKSNVGKIIGKILAERYPLNTESISLDELLDWDMWKTFIKIHKNETMMSGGSYGLSEQCTFLCACAESTLDGVCTRIKNGEVTLEEISLLKKKKTHVEVLLTENEAKKADGEQLKKLLHQRFDELEEYRERVVLLGQVCQSVKVPVKGFDQLLAEIMKDTSKTPIKDLCVKKAENFSFLSLESAIPLDDIKIKFDIMLKQNFSELFSKIWIDHMKTAATAKRKSGSELTIADIKTEIWEPAFKECQTLLDSLRERTIQLSAVDRYFKSVDHKKRMIQSLYAGVEKCMNNGVRDHDPRWITVAVDLMDKYWSLRELAEVADVVLNLKGKLGLTGDFTLIETLAKQVTSSMGNKPLSSISDELIQAGEFLKDFSDNPAKLECLKMFASSMKIVEWIRNETTEVNNLHKFVSVALHTAAGEGDLASDKLSHLKMIGSGFGPLIYDLKNDPSFETFKNSCKKVWKAMEQTPRLPRLLKDCNSEVEWFTSVKLTQGSVEVTSYGQMNNIFEYGCYKVGTRRPIICKSHSEVISLSLKEREKRLTKRNYNLDELRDLESKLVLITGSKAENRAKVDLFLDTLHSVCRIAEVLIDLQKFGNVKYTGWILQVPCSADSEFQNEVVHQLQIQAREMETELSDWKDMVKQTRHNFYELNYYTTFQLLTLRRELGAFKNSKETSVISPNVLALLQSISLDVSSDVVCDAVKQIMTQEIEQSSVDTQEPMDTTSSHASGTVPLTDEIMESADIHASTSSDVGRVYKDMPTLTKNDLSIDEKAIMANVMTRLNCSTSLVLKAFEECRGKEMDKYDYINWCNENSEKYEFEEEGDFMDEEESESEDESSSSSDSEPESFHYSSGRIEGTATTPVQKLSCSGIIKREASIQELVDEHHPVVKDLISAGYTVQQSIEAVEKCETLDASLNYIELLAVEDDDDEEEVEDLIPSYKHQLSREDSHPQDDFKMDWKSSDPPSIHADSRAEERHLNLEQLGNVLKYLSEKLQGEVREQRPFSKQFLKDGYPNLLVLHPDSILKAALCLYMENISYNLPLPTPEEILLCNPSTTEEEIELFWMRAVKDPMFKRIFCLVHAEKLSYQVSDWALRSLSDLTQGKQDYRLVIICSNEEEEKSHFISKLHLFRRHFVTRTDLQEYRRYLTMHFTSQMQIEESSISQYGTITSASAIDHESSRVRIVTSDRSGMGKSLYIQRLAENLKMNLRLKECGNVHVTIPLHGPVVTPDTVLELFKDHVDRSTCCIYHIDIAPNVLWEVDTILFSLLILRGMSDSQGRVWRCHPNQLYAVEVTLPNRDHIPVRDNKFFPESRTLSLLKLLPTVSCLSPRKALGKMQVENTDNSLVLMDDEEFRSDSYQRVYQYIRRHTAGSNLDSFSFRGIVEGQPSNCIEMILHHCGVRDPSWSEIRHFVKFLDLQLQSCEESVFTDSTLVGDVMSGLKGFVVKFMIRMSRDFSTSSLCGEIALEMGHVIEDGELDQYQISERRRWEQSPHPYIFFNEDRISITFVGFTVTPSGDLIDPTNQRVLERAIMTADLYKGLKENKVNFQDDYRCWKKHVMIENISIVMGVDYPHDPDESYVLTVDNLIKILAIQMRFRCGIPVVIMGETGCGKTRLIRYMCDLARQGTANKNMLILKVHGGTTEEEITRFIQTAELESEKNRVSQMDTVVFFDEANTTDAIGLIKEIMCDRRMNGKPISDDIKFIAACNPYRKHSEDMIRRLENAGLGFFVRATETQQKLGKIPLRQLVYRVLDLPPSMRPLVYDFGQLNMDTENDYIKQIVHDHISKHPKLSHEAHTIKDAIAEVLYQSQAYMRQRKDECSFVSLRDVERAMIVFEYLYDMMDTFGPLMDRWATGQERHIDNEDMDEEEFNYKSPGSIARALVLSVSVCYHARLQKREEYENVVVKCFTGPIHLPGGVEQFRDEIRWCQEVLLDSMQLVDNIARNAALRENVFMMAICVELRIPLFLVGKPGSSKSLAKSIISESMRGKDSKNDLLKKFKEVEIFSYQCSQLSTPQSVIEVFNNAKKFQAKQDKSSYVAVVVLDEVGLAEDSPNLPLKALHPLLEDGTEGASSEHKRFIDEIINREERVAFIGISNWALDPAKMNRGVMVTRADPSVKELEFSAKGICSNKEDDPIKRHLERYFTPFAQAYGEICKKQTREFFGLRDFYSLIKMLYYMCEKSKAPPTWKQLEHAIRRNFGGLESKELNPFHEFEKVIPMRQELPNLDEFPEELQSIVNPDCSRLGLIKTSLSSHEKTWHGENRYMLFLTENYAALDILKNPKNYLSDKLTITDVQEESMDLSTKDIQPFILFGSSFPKDKEYTQVCRNINQIKICMETGRTVILLNLENLYESLYDVLNQYYIYHGDSRYVDLGLQTHRVRCRVDKDFKLILIAEKDTVYERFPTPLINRLEKHFVLTSSVLEDWQEEVLNDFEDWIKAFSDTGDSKFKKSDAFIGFQKDTPASVIFQATNQLRSACAAFREGECTKRKWECILVWSKLSPQDWDIENVDNNAWKNAVLQLSKYLLLQTASPDAIVRLEYTRLEDDRADIAHIYFHEQHHSSIDDIMNSVIHESDDVSGLLVQVTTHSHLLSYEELKQVERATQCKVASFFLHEFDTELDFSNKVSPMFKTAEDGSTLKRRLVIIQCDSGHLNGDLIACARYRIYDLRTRADFGQITHVLFIIHLPHQVSSSSFVGFQGDPWISAHIDDLRPTSGDAVADFEAIGSTISELFLGVSITKRQRKESKKEDEEPGNLNQFESNPAAVEEEGTYRNKVEVEGLGDDSKSGISRSHAFIGSSEEMTSDDEEEKERDKKQELWAERVQDSKDSDMESEESLSQSGNSNEMSVEDIESDELEYRGIPEKMHDNKNIEANVKNFMNNDVSSLEPTQLSFRYSTTHHLNIPHHSPSNKYARETSRSPLFKRLYGCIQAAASRLKDVTNKRSTRRVEILVHLIPKEPPNTLVFNQFHGVLVQHIFEVLQEREEVFEGEKWVIKEAMNARNLQHGGTFRNALSRKVDEVVTPIFAEIIASVDRNYNLDLIDPKNENSPISKFWLSIFSDSSIMQFNYRDMVTPREQVPGVGGRKTGEDFKCELPFSWLIYDAVDSQWDNAKSLAGNDKSSLQKQLCDSIEPTPVGGVLRAVNQEDCEDFYKKYLNDFVRIVHRCNHNYESQEYELISSALDDLVHGDEFCSIDGNITVIDRISTIHVVYQLNKSKLLWFGQLVSCDPGIIVRLKSDQVHDRTEMVLHLHAVEKALESLDPLLDRENPAINLIPWLNDVRLFHNAITSIIDLPSQSAIKTQSRLKWEVIRTMQLFLEHVLLKHEFENSVAYLIRLQLHLKNQRDFKEVSTLKKIQSHINLMVREVKKKKLIKKSKEFRRHCHSYFMEVVSTLCFGGQRIPEPDLIRMLMQIIFMENPNSELTTQDLTPLTDGKVDEVPVVRSSLLQLLLEHNSESVKEHLKEYFDRSQKVLAGSHDEDLCLLCIQCFEDALYKENSNRLSEEKIEAIYDTLRKSYDVLKSPEMKKSTVHYLEAIAGFRFAFLEIANLLHSEREDCIDLFELAKDVCTDPVINTSDFTVSGIDVVGPAVYLLKLLVRKYGFPCLKQVYEKFNWIIPEGLRETNQEKVIDPFVLYNDTINYSALRETVSEAVFGKQIEKLVEATKDSTITEAAVLLLVFYKSITMSHSSPKKLMDEESLESFNQFTLDMKAFSPPMLQMARLLLINEQGGPLAQMQISPELPLEFKTLGSIVVHAISVFNTMAGQPILLPFINMMTNPAELKDAYLPTMRDDILLEVKALTGGQYYYCPRGHPYFVNNCGQPMEQGKCDTCGALIGGGDHKLRSDNAMATINRDTTQKGHDLGSVESRTCIPSPERSLSPRAVCIMRALMHSALLWCSCHHEDCMASLAELVKPFVHPQHLPEFFWRHLQKDIEHLSQVTGKGLEEAAIIVHLILKDILTKPPPTSDIISTVNSLRAKNAREHWEREFNNHYIQPVLSNLDKMLRETMDLIANDDKQGHDQLFYLVYERVKVNKDNMEPHLWSYHQRISLEHLSQTLQEKKLKEKYPILHEFLRVEPSLRATQYLPDIIKLQRCLYDTFHHRLDRKDAKTQTIREFLNKLKSENSRNEYRQRIESLKKAWLLVGQDLKTHGRLRLEEEHYLSAITEDVPLEYLIPTFSGAGACTTSLVDFLILIHNNFIEKCHSIAAEQSRSHSVPITHIHRCHLMDYEHQIVSIVLSHCRYSLKLGKAHNVEYDHQALEKHILDKFIHGKPMILSDIPQVIYRKDIYTTVTFDAVRKKVKPQIRLDSRLQKEIIADLRTPDRIRASLDVVDIVLGFLSSGGVKADKSLGEYIDKVLKMKRRQFSQKAREYCKLHHILSLWETLSVELARITWLRDQEPFDSVKDIYLKDLSEDPGDNQKAALDECLRTFDLDRLLGAFYEFIETHVKYSPTTELDWPLKDILVEDQYQYLGINPDQLEKFPDSICLDQTVAVWKYIVHYQEKLKQE